MDRLAAIGQSATFLRRSVASAVEEQSAVTQGISAGIPIAAKSLEGADRKLKDTRLRADFADRRKSHHDDNAVDTG